MKQMNGAFRLKNEELRRLFHQVKDRERAFKTVTYNHLPRTNPLIKKVDRMVNEAIEGRGRSSAT